MQLKAPESLIPEKNIVVFSPNYDDTLFMLGGYFGSLSPAQIAEKNIHIVLIFSQSNYQVKQGLANQDSSLKRVKFATGNRLLEDISCLNELLGAHQYRYELLNEEECFTRGKTNSNQAMEFPHGMWEDMNTQDYAIMERLVTVITNFATQANTAMVFPLAIKEHIDHFILREAAWKVKQTFTDAKASFYFIEDKPYGGLASPQELQRSQTWAKEKNLKSSWFQYNPEQLISLAFKHYVSQVEEVYAEGIQKRASYWKEQFNSQYGVDHILKAD
jgi:hypothetical protein